MIDAFHLYSIPNARCFTKSALVQFKISSSEKNIRRKKHVNNVDLHVGINVHLLRFDLHIKIQIYNYNNIQEHIVT